MPPTCKTQLEF
jgi:hypothetical protein